MLKNVTGSDVEMETSRSKTGKYPHPEPVYTGWFRVHWNATGMPLYTGIPLVDPENIARYTGTSLEKRSWKAPHWNATG